MQNVDSLVPKKKAGLCVFLNTLGFFLKIAMVQILAVLFNDIVAMQTDHLSHTIFSFVAVAVLVRVMNYLSAMLSNEMEREICFGLHTSLYESILRLEVPRAQSEDSASIAQRHLGKVQNYLLEKNSSLAFEVIRIIMAIAYIAIVSWQLLLFSLTAFPLVLIITGMLGGKIQQLNQSIQQKHREIDTMCAEALEAAESIRVHNLGSSLKKQFADRLAETYQEEKKLEKKLKLVNEPLSAISSFLLSIICVFWSGMLNYWGLMSIGSVIAMIGFYSNLISPILYFMNFSVLKKSALPSLAVVNDIIRSEELQTKASEVLQTKASEELQTKATDALQTKENEDENFVTKTGTPIEMRSVSFSYDEGKTILDHFSMQAEEGSITAISGESGAGKSTVFDLICGFLHPESGEILYWGNRENEVNMQTIREKMAYVSQTPFFFNETVLENLAYIRPGITLHDVQAINAACDGLFDDLMDYCEQPIGAFGGKLSGGMRQKLDILRLLAADASIYLLDEPSSALDAVSRDRLAQVLRQKKDEGKTILLISHQDSVRGLADREYTLYKRETGE